MTRPRDDLLVAASSLSEFAGANLTAKIGQLEREFRDASPGTLQDLLLKAVVSHELLSSAYTLKRVAGQINVVIHAIGILLCLPHILEPEERIKSLSLGAGNTGRAFDLETDRQVAEFKFINWQGGSETIRQNVLFKDLYLLAEHQTEKRKVMYVLGNRYPLKFLTSKRALGSVMSKNRALWDDFSTKYGSRFRTVAEYYAARRSVVDLVDVSQWVPELSDLTIIASASPTTVDSEQL